MTFTETPSARRSRVRGKAWRTYKNRKKTLRKQFLAGRITAEQRAGLLAEARESFEQDSESEAVRLAGERVRRGQEFLDNGGTVPRPDLLASTGSSTECCAECVGAQGIKCRCACEGANHGAAMGVPPESVYVPALRGRPYHPEYEAKQLRRMQRAAAMPPSRQNVSWQDWIFG